MNKKIIILMSGGLDSTVLFFKLHNEKKDIKPVFVNYGQHNASKECATIYSVLPENYKKDLKIIDLKSVYEESDDVLFKEEIYG